MTKFVHKLKRKSKNLLVNCHEISQESNPVLISHHMLTNTSTSTKYQIENRGCLMHLGGENLLDSFHIFKYDFFIKKINIT